MARPNARRRLTAAVLAVAGFAVILTGCSWAAIPDLAPTTSSTPAPSPTATASSLVPQGTAADNLPYFSDVVRGVWSGPQQVAGRAYVDALVAAGFDKAAMQVTPDQTTVGNAAETIMFSVRWGSECLVGQVGPSTGEPVATVVPGLADGGCLVGQTRAIDW